MGRFCARRTGEGHLSAPMCRSNLAATKMDAAMVSGWPWIQRMGACSCWGRGMTAYGDSTDRGVTWTRLTSFPDVTETIPPTPAPVAGETPDQRWRRMPVRGSGIVFVKFVEPILYEGAAKPTATIYVGVSLMGRANLFVSHDVGATWHEVAGAPTQYRPTRAALSVSSLYITYGNAPGPSPMTDGAVWKMNLQTGAWTDITPDKPVKGSREFGYAAVSVDDKNQQALIVSTYNRYRAGGEDIFRSTDEGATWKPIFTGESAGDGVL